MATQKRITVNTKISEEESERLNSLAERENISVSALIKLFVRALIDGEITIEKGELKTCPTHDEYCVSGISEEDFQENLRYKELRFDRLLAAFEKRKHPDNIIRQEVEQMIISLLESPDYTSKKGGNDWGA